MSDRSQVMKEPEHVEWAGKYICAKRRGTWEYVSRAGGMQAAVILAIDAGEVILVDQFRVALGRRCLELPAGLIGDEEGDEGEDVFSAAERELEEETGYAAARWDDLGTFYSSPGMASECFHLLRASGLTRVGNGGGTESEDITVHRLPLSRIDEAIADFREDGLAIDVRLLLLLGAGMLQENEA